MHSANKVEHKN